MALPELISDEVDDEDEEEDNDWRLFDENCCKVVFTFSNRTGSTDWSSFCRIFCTPISFSLLWRSRAPSSLAFTKLDTQNTAASWSSTELWVFFLIEIYSINNAEFELFVFVKRDEKKTIKTRFRTWPVYLLGSQRWLFSNSPIQLDYRPRIKKKKRKLLIKLKTFVANFLFYLVYLFLLWK